MSTQLNPKDQITDALGLPRTTPFSSVIAAVQSLVQRNGRPAQTDHLSGHRRVISAGPVAAGNFAARDLQNRIAKSLGIPEGSTEAEIHYSVQVLKESYSSRKAHSVLAQHEAASRAFAQTSTPPRSGVTHSNGVALLSREEAQETLLFGATSGLLKERVNATERHFGKDLREILKEGKL